MCSPGWSRSVAWSLKARLRPARRPRGKDKRHRLPDRVAVGPAAPVRRPAAAVLVEEAPVVAAEEGEGMLEHSRLLPGPRT